MIEQRFAEVVSDHKVRVQSTRRLRVSATAYLALLVFLTRFEPTVASRR